MQIFAGKNNVSKQIIVVCIHKEQYKWAAHHENK